MGVLGLVAVLSNAGEIVLYDAAITPVSAVVSHSGGKFAVKDGVLEVATKGNTGYPGVLIKGTWDLSACNRIAFELMHRDHKRDLPLTVRLDNPDANSGKSQGVFVDQVKLSGKGLKTCSVALPPALPYGREISSKLFGMRNGPLMTAGIVADLDASKVVGVAVYMKEPKLDWLWGVKRIVAYTGETAAVPDWMKLPADKFSRLLINTDSSNTRTGRVRCIPMRI